MPANVAATKPAYDRPHRPQYETAEVTSHEGPAKSVRYSLATLRMGLGWIFFWAFLDKMFGLGFATKAENAWIAGGSPTYGFLTFGTSGPFAAFYQGIAGHVAVDALFMMGLLGIGVALLTGIGVRIAAGSGILMMLLMWSAALPLANNPLVDEHIVYAVALALLAFAHASRYVGLGAWWESQAIVRKYPFLQ